MWQWLVLGDCGMCSAFWIKKLDYLKKILELIFAASLDRYILRRIVEWEQLNKPLGLSFDQSSLEVCSGIVQLIVVVVF